MTGSCSFKLLQPCLRTLFSFSVGLMRRLLCQPRLLRLQRKLQHRSPHLHLCLCCHLRGLARLPLCQCDRLWAARSSTRAESSMPTTSLAAPPGQWTRSAPAVTAPPGSWHARPSLHASPNAAPRATSVCGLPASGSSVTGYFSPRAGRAKCASSSPTTSYSAKGR